MGSDDLTFQVINQKRIEQLKNRKINWSKVNVINQKGIINFNI